MNAPGRRSSNALRLLAGWGGLLLYVGALSPLGFAAAVFLGELDPDHHILLQPGEQGMRLVLHHAGNGAGHHHRAMARVLAAFAQPASATDPDHVLKFSSAIGTTRESQLIAPTAKASEPISVVFAAPVSLVANGPIQFILPPRPPPGGDGKLLCLRSTLLLL